MNAQGASFDPEAFIRRRFANAGIQLRQLDERSYPDETIFVLRVEPPLEPAAELGNAIDRELVERGFKGFVTVRLAETSTGADRNIGNGGVVHHRASTFLTLITARSRASEAQPSLSYVPNRKEIIATVVSPRHHLIFG